MINPFFENTGPHNINYLIKSIKLNIQKFPDDEITDIKDLNSSQKGELTFFHSNKYKDFAKLTKASYCLTKENLKSILPSSCKPIISDNVLLHTAQITKIFYPKSVTDDYDNSAEDIQVTEYKDKVDHGKNVLIGKNVKIGQNCKIGHNSIIERNVSIGDNCVVGSNVIIRNALINNHVHILDGCVIGKKGFGFFPDKSSNIRYPQVGMVIINDHAEIGCGSTIDRGSLSNTVIGKNTFLDNQIHVAHNVKIGDNCIIAGQVGFAGSTTIGNNCKIGHNSIIEKNVSIGDNCVIGSNVIIRNSLIKNHVHILDGCVIGKKGFGFFPDKSSNIRYPQVGIVIINDHAEIGCGSTIDRGSLSNTVIGKNTFLDNQIHVAHNVKIGDNCIIAGQVGFAGSTTIGNNVMIGGQAGISGHLKIGDNVQIGGGSGVIKNIQSNSKVMGYPAKDLKNFIKDNK